jgi:hypothetical protein
LRQLRGFLDEGIVNRFVNKSTRSSATALAHVGENGIVARFHGLVDCKAK